MGENLPAAVAEFRLQAKQFLDELHRVQSAAKTAEGEVVSRLSIIEQAAKNHLGNAARSSGLLGQALQTMSSLGISSSMLMSAGIVAGVGIAGAAITHFVRDGINHYLALTDQIRTFQRVSGATAQESSGIVAAANALGVSVDVISRGMLRLSRAASETPDKLHKLGVEIAYNKDGNTDLTGTLLNVAEAYAGTTDQAQRNALALLFNQRSAMALIPLLKEGREGLQRFFDTAKARGEIFTQKDLDQAKQMKISARELHNSWEAPKGLVARGLVPAIEGFERGLAAIINAHGNLKRAHELASGSGHDFSHSLAEAEIAAEENKTKIDDLKGSVMGLIQAQRAAADADLRVKDAEDALVDKRHRLNDLMREAAHSSYEVMKAEHDLERASRSLHDAQTKLVEAQERMNRALELPEGRDQALAEEDLAKAQLALERAKQRHVDAQLSLNDAISKGNPSDVANAELDLRDAVFGVTDASRSLEDAQRNLNDLIREAKPGTREYRDAQKELESAQIAVQQAEDAQVDASQRLQDVHTAEIKRSYEVTRAKRDLERAEKDITDAKLASIDATLKLADAADKESQALLNDRPVISALAADFRQMAADKPELTGLINQIIGLLGNPSPVSPNNSRFFGSSHAGWGMGIDEEGKPKPGFLTFAEGGIVPGVADAPVLAIVHGGEEVIPRRLRPGGSISVGQIIIPGASDPKATAIAVREELLRMARRTGTVGLQ